MSNEFTLKEWADMPEEYFDEEEYFDAEVKPLLDQVRGLCEARGIGMFTAVEFMNAETSRGVHVSSIFAPGRASPQHLVAIPMYQTGSLRTAAMTIIDVDLAYSSKPKAQ